MLEVTTQWEKAKPTKTKNLVDAILAARGITREELEYDPKDPFLMPDMDKATDEILRAIDAGEKIGVYGDYDVDGMTGGALLTIALQRLGGEAQLYIPTREDGFGLSLTSVKKMVDDEVRLIITVDNGSTRKAEVDYAHELGARVVITDHHLTSMEEMADAEALINVCRPDSKYDFTKLCGSATAYMLAEALAQVRFQRSYDEGNPQMVDVSDLIAYASLGTLADVMPLIGPNRHIVQQGLHRLREVPGLKSLLHVKKMGDNYSARDVVFSIVPMLNAPGRLESPQPAVDLLLTQNIGDAEVLAQRLHEANEERKVIGKRMETLAKKQVNDPRLFPRSLNSIFLFTTHGWKHGMLGPLAGKLAETYGRPTFIAAGTKGSDWLKGSARSGVYDEQGKPVSVKTIMDNAEAIYQRRYRKDYPEHEHLCEALDPATGKVVEAYGGHDEAAGFTVHVDLAKVMGDCLDKAAAPLMENVPSGRIIRPDVVWTLPTPAELAEIATLEPTGKGFEAPLIMVEDVVIAEVEYETIPGQPFRNRIIRLQQGDVEAKAICYIPGQHFYPGQHLDVMAAPQGQGLLIQHYQERQLEAPIILVDPEDMEIASFMLD